MNKRWLAALLLAALALVAAGCGGDDGGDSARPTRRSSRRRRRHDGDETATTAPRRTRRRTTVSSAASAPSSRASVREAPERSAPASGDLDSASEVFDELAERVPEEIRDDYQVLADELQGVRGCARGRRPVERRDAGPGDAGEAPEPRQPHGRARGPAGDREHRGLGRGELLTRWPSSARDAAAPRPGPSKRTPQEVDVRHEEAERDRRKAGQAVQVEGVGRHERQREQRRSCRTTSPPRAARIVPPSRGTARRRARRAGRGAPPRSRPAARTRSRSSRRCRAPPRRRPSSGRGTRTRCRPTG